jgi:hypothetical protein
MSSSPIALNLTPRHQDGNHNNNIKTYRFEFSKDFIDELSRFSKVHQFDERRTYKEAWQKWKSNPEISDVISGEIRRLNENGYKGNIEDKMFKSGRYYFRKKSIGLSQLSTSTSNDLEPASADVSSSPPSSASTPTPTPTTAPTTVAKPPQQQRRPYITMSKTCIRMMDRHIETFSNNNEFKPSTSYDNFYQENMSSPEMTNEIENIIEKYDKILSTGSRTVTTLDEITHEIMDKIKKTYKNRYYRFVNSDKSIQPLSPRTSSPQPLSQ